MTNRPLPAPPAPSGGAVLLALMPGLSRFEPAVAATGDPRLRAAFAEASAAAAAWLVACERFDAQGRRAVETGSPAAIRSWNEVARWVDRRFLVAEGLQGHPGPRHLLAAPGERTGSRSTLLATLDEDLRRGDLAGVRGKLARLTELLRAQVDALAPSSE